MKRAQLHGAVPLPRIDQEVGDTALEWHADWTDEAARAQLIGDEGGVRHGDAQSVHRALVGHARVFEHERLLDLQARHAGGGKPSRPVIGSAERMQQHPARQLARRAFAVRSSRLGTMHGDQNFIEEALAEKALVEGLAVLHRRIDIIVLEVRWCVRGRYLHRDVRMVRVKANEPRHEPAHGKSGRQLQPQDAVGVTRVQGSRGLGYARKTLAHIGQVDFPGACQHHLAMPAREQPGAEKRLQVRDLATDCASCHAQLLCGAAEAQMASCGVEGAHGVQGRQVHWSIER